jgi:hypothetical protein
LAAADGDKQQNNPAMGKFVLQYMDLYNIGRVIGVKSRSWRNR